MRLGNRIYRENVPKVLGFTIIQKDIYHFMKQIQSLFTLIVLLFTALGCGTTDNPIGDGDKIATLTGTLQGEVQSIDGVAIQVRLLKAGQLVAHSEAHSHYELNDIEAGDYTLQISANGYQEVALNVTVVGGETVSLDKVSLVELAIPGHDLEPGEGLNIGSQAPAFELPDGNGELHTLSEYIGNHKKVVLVFYRTGG